MVDQDGHGAASGDGAAADSRRAFIRRVAYTAPALLTLAAIPAMAQTGSQAPPAPDCDALNPNNSPGFYQPVFDPNTGTWSCES